ncbi:MAG: hypothetical protein Q9173_002456 [Seirophora scorigena]
MSLSIPQPVESKAQPWKDFFPTEDVSSLKERLYGESDNMSAVERRWMQEEDYFENGVAANGDDHSVQSNRIATSGANFGHSAQSNKIATSGAGFGLSDHHVTGTLWYLDQLPLYRTTKPYVVNLPLSLVPAGKRTNQVSAAFTGIGIRDIRAAESEFDLDRHGFELSRSIPMTLKYDEFRDPIKVRDVYCETVKYALSHMTGAQSATILHQATTPRGRRTKVFEPLMEIKRQLRCGKKDEYKSYRFGDLFVDLCTTGL